MGKMNELGEKTLLLQDEVIEDALSVFDLVLAIDLDSNIKDENFKIIDSKAIYKNLEIYLNEESVILFKASRSVKMEKIVKLFK
jgi:UDP-N-acetylmuramyl pentapeptide synthase